MGNFLVDEIGLTVTDELGAPVPSPHGGLGRWGNTRTPHSGWKCAAVFHSEARPEAPYLRRIDDVICQMCETAAIHYVYQMKHPAFAETLYVGYCCAAHMSGEPQRMQDLLDDEKAIRAAVKKYRGVP